VGSRGGAPVNPLAGGTAVHNTVTPTQANAGWRFNTNGSIDIRVGASYTVNQNWFNPNSTNIGNQYWARATLSSGTSPGGDVVGSWLALTSAREWNLSQSIVGLTTCTLTIAIASDAAGTNIVGSGSFTITVEQSI
jgi:hypothetical protein